MRSLFRKPGAGGGPEPRARGPGILAPLLSGLVASLPFQKNVPGILVWIALVPFFLLLRSDRSRRSLLGALRMGWLYGLGFFLGLLYWIGLLSRTAIPVRGIALGGLLLLAIYFAFYPGLFALLVRLGERRFPVLLIGPLAWGVTEHLRSLGVLGFPWGSLGYAIVDYPVLIQLARIGSVDILTLLVVACNLLLAQGIVFLVRRRFRGALLCYGAALLLVLLAAIDGTRVIRRGLPEHTESLRVAVVQPNIPADKKWTEDFKLESIRVLSDLTREAAEENDLDLVVWPETGVPVYVRHEYSYYHMVLDLVRDLQVPLLFGFPDAEYVVDAGYEYYNAALLLDASGKPRGEYRKIHLVPFGERLPLHDQVDWVARLDLGEADFTPGEEYTVFLSGKKAFSANICFEAIFAPLCRQFVLRGARFLVNLTNDAWFGTTSAPYQHAAMARLRCVELKRYLARSANTGISLVADPFGRAVSSLGLFKTGFVVADVVPIETRTFYARHGDWLPRVEMVLLAGLLVVRWVARRWRP